MPWHAPSAVVIAAATCGSVAMVAAALAAVYAWHRLRGPVPLVAWAASSCVSPHGYHAADLEVVLNTLSMPKNGVVQVTLRCPWMCSWQCAVFTYFLDWQDSLVDTIHGICCWCICVVIKSTLNCTDLAFVAPPIFEVPISALGVQAVKKI